MNVRSLSPLLEEIAKKEINEKFCKVQDDVNHIRKWISKQPHLNARTDDQWLLSFLRGCKFSLERTKEKLDMYYTMRTLAPENFGNRDPFSPDIQEFLSVGVMVLLPKTAGPAGPRISIFRLKNANPEKLSVETIFTVTIMVLDILMHDDNYVIAGTHTIIDLEGIDYNYLTQITPSFLKKVVTFVQKCYPLRLKGIHLINCPSYFEVVINTAKIFFSKKMSNRLSIYSKKNMGDLYKVIPLSILPKDYGGDERTLDELAIEHRQKLESYKDWFLEDAQYFSDETKRVGKPKTSAEMFGVEGSFRKLDVD